MRCICDCKISYLITFETNNEATQPIVYVVGQNPEKQKNWRPTVCPTELDTTFKINNSYSRPDIDPQFSFLEGCKYCDWLYLVKVAEMSQIKFFLAYGTFFGRFLKNTPKPIYSPCQFFKIVIFYSPCQFCKIKYFFTI